LPAINGYNSSADVASDNLLAYWSFDGTNSETISSTAPSTAVGDAFVTGVKGQALGLTAGYLLYPTIAKLSGANAFPSVSVSLWVQISNNGTEQTNLFGITQPLATESDWNTGPLNVYVETGNHPAASDTLQVHSDFSTYIGGTRYGGDNVNNYGGVAGTDYQYVTQGGKWFHYVMEYDGVGSNIDLYVNGVVVSDDMFRNREYTPAGGSLQGLGPIVNSPGTTQVVIGAFPTAAVGFTNSAIQSWQQLMTGNLDEIRVYSKALTPLEIGSLYALELAGR
jgi:hypothetical protein